jgi:serine/threonine-protein kinase
MNHPTQLGKYAISEVIGEGAMGVVYKATDTVLRRTVAIKMLRRRLIEQGGGAPRQARFRNEAQAAARLMHPNIVTVHDYGEHELEPYIVMEYVDGTTLKEPLRNRVRHSDDEVIGLMCQLLDGLHFAHEQGVWHRDVKPANLLMTSSGRLKIADFGIARIATMGLTQLSSSIGTPGHMAPEQYAGEQVDRRVDIFAAGVLLYQLLTQRAPFGGSNENVMFQTLNSDPLPPSRVHGSGRPAWFDAVVARAMAKRPEDRFATALDFEAALRSPGGAATAPDPVEVPPPAAASHTPDTAPLPLETAWDPSTLTQLEEELAQAIGPMAGVLVRRALRTSPDLDNLRTTLASHIDEPLERDTFMRRTRPRAGGTTATRTQPSASRTHSGDDTLLGERVVRQAETELARYLGPIAKVVVGRAASKAQSRDEFFELLTRQLGSEVDREQLLHALQRLGRPV